MILRGLDASVFLVGRRILELRGVSWFFFFQAEDGIRDYKVTGVQTCALPILGRARISGFELKADYDWGRWAGGDWQTRLAYGYTDGKDTQSDKPLDTISPQQLVLGVRYERSAVGVQFNVSHWSGKKAEIGRAHV